MNSGKPNNVRPTPLKELPRRVEGASCATCAKSNNEIPNFVPTWEADRLLRLPEVLRLTGLSRSSLYRLMSEGFPLNVHLSANSVAWVFSEVAAWCAARVAERGHAGPHSRFVEPGQ